MPKQAKPLTDTECRNAKARPDGKPAKLYDGGGLFLKVDASGSKLWRWKYTRPGIGGENSLSPGRYPEVSLKQAREQVAEWRRLRAQGIDPGEHRKATKEAAAHTFEAVAREWFTTSNRARGWAVSHSTKIMGRLMGHVFPIIGRRPIASLRAPDVLDLLQRVERRDLGDTVLRVRQTCGEVFRYGIAAGYCEIDATHGLQARFQAPKREHYPTITDPAQVGELMRNLDACTASYVVAAALRLAPLVCLRPGELRGLRWEEVDLENAQLVIRAERMKLRRKHVVPLSRQAAAILRDVQRYTGDGPLVFPGRSVDGRVAVAPVSGEALNKALTRMGYGSGKLNGHGFRGMASTLLNESHQFAGDAIERQLDHRERNRVKAAYDHSKHMPERVRMMQWWADYLDSLKAGSTVVPMRRAG